jgi:hypothetical protein
VSWYEQRRFQVLLAALILMFALDALFGVEVRGHAVGFVYALVLVLTAVSTFPAGVCRLVGLVLAGIALVGHVAGYVLTGIPLLAANLADYIGGALFLFYALGMILTIILRENEITIDTISGAVCGYLLLGLGCAWLFALIETLAPGSFFTVREDFLAWLADARLRRSLLAYYSFTTLSTAGYGDITPLSQPARTLSWAEAVAGQFYMAILVAGLVGIRISQLISLRAEKSPSGDTANPLTKQDGTNEVRVPR